MKRQQTFDSSSISSGIHLLKLHCQCQDQLLNSLSENYSRFHENCDWKQLRDARVWNNLALGSCDSLLFFLFIFHWRDQRQPVSKSTGVKVLKLSLSSPSRQAPPCVKPRRPFARDRIINFLWGTNRGSPATRKKQRKKRRVCEPLVQDQG